MRISENKFKSLEENYDLELRTDLGVLFNNDCLEILNQLPEKYFDLVFLDPPFNLDKNYGDDIADDLDPDEYRLWSKEWLDESIRVLKDGGALFLYHLPEKLITFGEYLNSSGMEFRHWISVEFKSTYPIKGKLYPAHYGLLYYTKGTPQYFERPKKPIPKCPSCGDDLKDYGGKRDHIVENGGLNVSDIWTDFNPVRHNTTRNREANELPEDLMERIISMSTKEENKILDPFSGSGTTLIMAEKLNRFWFGIEKANCQPIINRFEK